MPRVSRLGHFGLRVKNLQRALSFYRDILGLQMTTESREDKCLFLTSRPDEEHHELLISERPEEKRMISQIAFRVNSLEDLKEFSRFFEDKKIPIQSTRTHGHSISIYLHDPEANLIEIYWVTGLDVKGPISKAVDLSRSREEILAAHLS
ncbi:MAG: VOC family protein [Deltaproteobacteria bacterium]|nr:VOC family protein [Deltaproteobacteria bacterium]